MIILQRRYNIPQGMFFRDKKVGWSVRLQVMPGYECNGVESEGGSVRSQAEQEWGRILKKEGGSVRLLVQILDCSLRS